MPETYKNFKELVEHEKESVDFQIDINDKKSKYVVIAIHGGGIEPFTTEIAKEFAGDTFSFYSFVGRKNTEQENQRLHIESTDFDEPQCCDLVYKSFKTLSIHGKYGDEEFVMVGGLDNDIIGLIINALMVNNFNVYNAPDNVNGDSPKNICNKCISGKGVQIEISRGLREKFMNDSKELSIFCSIIRECIK